VRRRYEHAEDEADVKEATDIRGVQKMATFLVGSYVIVQDTGMATPSLKKWQWANMAVDDFMAGNDRFVVDRSRERLVLTNNPGGFLKRVK
jgi:hypothetical protein